MSPPALNSQHMFVAYYESWAAPPARRFDEILANLPRQISVLNLAFMKPDTHYSGGFDLSDTGLNLPYSGEVLKQSIDELKDKNPETRILISVGGETDRHWERLDAAAIKNFVVTFGFDGVDIDFEPSDPGCRGDANAGVICDSDGLLARTIDTLRSVFPPPLVISLTLPSTAAFGAGAWNSAKPIGGPHYGLALSLLRDSHRLQEIDLINTMMYDTGEELDPVDAYEAFRSYYNGPITIGFTPPPEAWGSHAYSAEEIRSVLEKALNKGANGAMLFGLRKEAPDASISPLADTIAKALTSRD
jgi:chitinase